MEAGETFIFYIILFAKDFSCDPLCLPLSGYLMVMHVVLVKVLQRNRIGCNTERFLLRN